MLKIKYKDEERKAKVNPKIVRSVLLDGNLFNRIPVEYDGVSSPKGDYVGIIITKKKRENPVVTARNSISSP